jgi:hypothetical protein
MADAQDLKSWGLKKPCGFKSHHRHHVTFNQWNQGFDVYAAVEGVGITVAHYFPRLGILEQERAEATEELPYGQNSVRSVSSRFHRAAR